MKILLPVLLVLTQATMISAQVEVGGPTQTQDPNYPLQIIIVERSTSRSENGSLRMWGRADLFAGQQEQGFDFESTCDEKFMVTHGEERYSARWKKPNEQLEMLVSRIGTGKANKCVLKADLKDFVYNYNPGSDGHITTRPVRSSDNSAPPATSNSPAPTAPPSPQQ